MRKLSYLLTLLTVCASSVAFAQSRTVTGTVSDESGAPLAGVMVTVQGTTTAAITENGGKYSVSAPDGATLDFSLLGYTAVSRAVDGRSVVDVTMTADVMAIDDVIVVGYGTVRKAHLTGSVTQIDSETLTNRPVQNVSMALQGMMPGVTVMASGSGGTPGQDGGTIRVRGTGTLNNASPYILIDGVESGQLNEVDPNDIESISVLKDAASAAIYGSKAANGVILITTKRGTVGRPQISYNGNVGIQNVSGLIERMGSAEYAENLNRILTDAGKEARWSNEAIQKFRDHSDLDNFPDTDWYGEAFQTGFQQTHNVNINGGTEAVRYMASAGYLGMKGILPNSKRNQFSARTNISAQINPRLSARLNLSYIDNDYSDANAGYSGGSHDQIIRQLNIIAPWIAGRKSDGTYGANGDGNPIEWLDSGMTVDRMNQSFTGVAGVDYKIAEGLVATATGAYVSDIQHYKDFRKKMTTGPNSPNQLDERYYLWDRTNFDVMLNYEKAFGSHNLKLMGAWHTEKYNSKELRGFRNAFPNNDLTDMNAGTASSQTNSGFSRELAMVSALGRLNYDYAGKYLFEAIFRSDASSRFAAANRWGYFPSLSAGWRVSEENFMDGARGWLTNLKLRGSWGLTGNQDALDDYYPYMNTYSLGANYPIGGTLQSGYYQGTFKKNSISWEEVRSWGIGLDITLMGKIDIVIDYYDRKTNGILMDVAVPSEFGLGAYKDNVGNMSNKGVEFSVGYNDRWDDWRLTANANVSYNKNEVLYLGEGVPYLTNGNMRRAVGHAFDSYYAYKADGFFASDEEANAYTQKYAHEGFAYKFQGGDLRYVDTNGRDDDGNLTGKPDGKVNADDRVYLNPTQPKVIYGINYTVGWKNLDLSMIWSGAAGSSRLYNYEAFGDFRGDNSHPSTIWRDSWTFNKTNPKMPRLYENVSSNSSPANVISSYWIQNTSFLRLKNLQLGYNFPAKWLDGVGVSKARIYYSAENLVTFHNIPINLDPEIASERTSTYPLFKSHSFGVNITF